MLVGLVFLSLLLTYLMLGKLLLCSDKMNIVKAVCASLFAVALACMTLTHWQLTSLFMLLLCLGSYEAGRKKLIVCTAVFAASLTAALGVIPCQESPERARMHQELRALAEREREENNIKAVRELNEEKDIEFSELLSRAEGGDVRAQLELGACYRGELKVKGAPSPDPAESVKWVRRAAEQGDPEGQMYLGAYCLRGYGVGVDKAEGLKWLKKSADQGYAKAQVYLVGCYYTGDGTPIDEAEAAYWAKRAAEQGYVRAQLALAGFYLRGDGVRASKAEAVRWYRKAADRGSAFARLRLFELE